MSRGGAAAGVADGQCGAGVGAGRPKGRARQPAPGGGERLAWNLRAARLDGVRGKKKGGPANPAWCRCWPGPGWRPPRLQGLQQAERLGFQRSAAGGGGDGA